MALIGGNDKAAEQAVKAYNEKEYRWAAQLANYVLLSDSGHTLAKKVQEESFKAIAFSTESANERNYLLTSVKKDLNWKKIYAGTGLLSRSKQKSAALLELMEIRFKAELAPTDKLAMAISISEESDGHTLEADRGILLYKTGFPAKPDGKISLSRDLLIKLSIGAVSWSDALAAGGIKIEEGPEAVKKFVTLIDVI